MTDAGLVTVALLAETVTDWEPGRSRTAVAVLLGDVAVARLGGPQTRTP